MPETGPLEGDVLIGCSEWGSGWSASVGRLGEEATIADEIDMLLRPCGKTLAIVNKQ